MVHQSLATRPAVPSRTVPPESHSTRDILDVFGSRDNVDDRSDSRRCQRHCADGGFDPHPPGDTRAVKIPGLSGFQAEKDIDIIDNYVRYVPNTVESMC